MTFLEIWRVHEKQRVWKKNWSHYTYVIKNTILFFNFVSFEDMFHWNKRFVGKENQFYSKVGKVERLVYSLNHLTWVFMLLTVSEKVKRWITYIFNLCWKSLLLTASFTWVFILIFEEKTKVWVKIFSISFPLHFLHLET